MSSPHSPTQSSPRFAKKKVTTLQQVDSDGSSNNIGCTGGSTMIGILAAVTQRCYERTMLGVNHHSTSDLEDDESKTEDDEVPNGVVDVDMMTLMIMSTKTTPTLLQSRTGIITIVKIQQPTILWLLFHVRRHMKTAATIRLFLLPWPLVLMIR
jgi:hypothetical protein